MPGLSCHGYHCQMVNAMLPFVGQTLRTRQISAVCEDSGYAPMSACLPNDHASGNKQPWCEMQCDNSAFQIFDRIGYGVYRVREILYWCDKTVAGT